MLLIGLDELEKVFNILYNCYSLMALTVYLLSLLLFLGIPSRTLTLFYPVSLAHMACIDTGLY